jgi:uncharacterized protein (DUF983 family)
MAEPSAWRAGLACRCPRCGEGPVFAGFLSVRERCPHCALPLAAQDTGDGPAVFLIFLIGAVAVPLAIAIEVWFTVPVWVPALVAGLFAVAATFALLRPAKALVMALHYRHRQ